MTKNKPIIISPKLLERLRRITIIENIGASTRLSGSKLSNKEIERLLLRLRSYLFKNQNKENY